MKHEVIVGKRRKPINCTMDADLLAEAKTLGVNISRVCEKALSEELRRVRGERWREENREAMLAWNVWIEENGLPFEGYRVF